MSSLTPHSALVHTMVMASAIDAEMTDSELLRDTAYAFACEIVAADGHASQEELQFLEVLSYDLEIDPLAAAAIQRGARARHARI